LSSQACGKLFIQRSVVFNPYEKILLPMLRADCRELFAYQLSARSPDA